MVHIQRRAVGWSFQECVGEGQKVFLFSVVNDQQRGFARAELYRRYTSYAVSAVDDLTSHKIANICLAGFKLRPFCARDLQLATQESFGVVDGIDAFQLQNQAAFVRPKSFQFDFAAIVILAQRKQMHAGREAIGMTGMQFNRDFAVAALRFENTGEGNEFVVDGGSPGLLRPR